MTKAILMPRQVAGSFRRELQTTNTKLRLLSFKDFRSLHKLFAGDPDTHWLVEDFGMKNLNSVWKTLFWTMLMLMKQVRHSLVPYIITTREDRVIGLALIQIYEDDLNRMDGHRVEADNPR